MKAAPVRWTHRTAGKAVGVLLALGLVAWLLRTLDLAALRTTTGSVPGWLWCAALLGLCTSYLLRAWRLHGEWHQQLAFMDCLRLMLLHNAAVNLLPFRAGEITYAWLLNRRFGVPIARSVISLAWLRLQDGMALSVLAAAHFVPGTGRWPAVTLLISAWIGVLWFGPHAFGRLSDALPDRFRSRFRVIAEAVRSLRRQRGTWLLCGANWLVKLAVIGALLAALAGIAPMDAMRGALGGELGALLPAQAPAGLGSYEAGVWLGIKAGATAPAEPALLVAAALSAHGFTLAASLVAAAVAWLAHRPPSSPGEKSCVTTSS